MRAWKMRDAVMAVLLMAPVVVGAAEAPAAGENDMEEVEIRGTRLYEMRESIVKTEDKFFARYNQLNQIREFDIVCTQQARTGTLVTKRVCRPRAVDNATADEAQGFLEAMQDGGGARSHATDSIEVLLVKEPEYEANMLKILNGDRELKKLVQERDRLQKRYDKARQEQFKARMSLAK